MNKIDNNLSATICQVLSRAAKLLPGGTARLDAELLLADILNKPRSHLYAWPEQSLSPDQRRRFLNAIDRRVAGEPIAYLTGHREFWSLDLRVMPGVLIPRPETELLVELALDFLPETTCKVADLGTGSGAIALALASERPNWKLTATDLDNTALETARDNARALQLGSLNFVTGDWYEALPERNYQLIISNPPYVADRDPHLKHGDVRFEPQTALTSGKDGLRDIRHLIAGAADYLNPGGWLMLEHGYNQAQSVIRLFKQAGFTSVETRHDLAEQPRVTIGAAEN